MFIVDLNRENFEYDVQALVRAFYPEEQVQVLTPATRENTRRRLSGQARLRIEIKDDVAEFVMDGEHSLYDPVKEKEALALPEGKEDGERDAVLEEIWSRGFKDGFKRYLYALLHHATGKVLPWGNLTGIRPTKIAYGMLEQSRSDRFILD